MGFLKDTFDAIFGGDDKSRGYEVAADILEQVEIPALRSLILDLVELTDIGVLNPEEAQAFLMSSTGFEDIELDPELQRRQYQSLRRFGEIADSEGLDAAARYRLREAEQEAETQLRGDLGYIDSLAARRGEGVRSGRDEVNRRLAAQAAAQRLSDRGLQAAMLGQQRADQALASQAQLAAGMESAQYGRQADIARARDAIQEFNARQRQGVENMNVGNINRAREFNLNREMDRDIFNIGQRNREEASRVGAIESDFGRRYGRAQDLANLRVGRGAAQQDEDETRRGNVSDLLSGASDIASGIGGAISTVGGWFSDEDMKSNVRKFGREDIEEFLDSITGYKYNVRGTPSAGLMSDDLKESEIGATVVTVDPETGSDVVDYEKLIPPLVASMTEISKRLKEKDSGY